MNSTEFEDMFTKGEQCTKEPKRNLLVGCGFSREKLMGLKHPLVWEGELLTMDYNSLCTPNILWDANVIPWRADHGLPLMEDYFDEIHAYEVLEHLGRQGDITSFFDTFNEIYRLLKPNGYLFATTPSRHSPWLWGDPGHRRAIIGESLVFLDRGRWSQGFKMKSPMADYRAFSQCDLDIQSSEDNHERHLFCLKAIKPARSW